MFRHTIGNVKEIPCMWPKVFCKMGDLSWKDIRKFVEDGFPCVPLVALYINDDDNHERSLGFQTAVSQLSG